MTVDDYALREIDESFWLIPLHKIPETVLAINETGAWIWKTWQKTSSLTKTTSLMSKKYHLSYQKAENDLRNFLAAIEKEKGEKLIFKNLSKYQNEKFLEFKAKRIPIRGSFELTGQCNLACFHCYALGEREKKGLKTDQIKGIIDQLTKAGCLFLHLTGGEVAFRPDFAEIYLYIRKKGIIPTISTNATLLNDKLLEIFKKWPPFRLLVSLYGSQGPIHDRVTGVKGSFLKTHQNLQELKRIGLKVRLRAIIFKENFKNMEEIKCLAKKIGMPVDFYCSLIPRLTGDTSPLKHALEEEKRQKVFDFNKDSLDEFLLKKPKPLNRNTKEIYFPCSTGLVNFHLNCQGELFLCQTERTEGYSILKDGFEKNWQKLKDLREKKLKTPKKCLSCSKLKTCEKCPPMLNLFKQSGLKLKSCVKIDYN